LDQRASSTTAECGKTKPFSANHVLELLDQSKSPYCPHSSVPIASCWIGTEHRRLAEEIEEYDLIQSIPGIGHKIAVTILSEIGEVERFDHPKKRVAFAGIDPSVFASGKFTATRNRITKRGSKQLRYKRWSFVEFS